MHPPASRAEFDNPSATAPDEVAGLALLDGVMMRSRTGYALAQRVRDGGIRVVQVPWRSATRSAAWLRLPGVRSVVGIVETLAIGMRALQWSADLLDQQAAPPANALAELRAGSSPVRLRALPRSLGESLWGAGDGWAPAGAIGLVLVATLLAPPLVAAALGSVPWFASYAAARGTLGFSEENHPVAWNVVAGVLRAVLVLGYVALIAQLADVRRVFQYHGAEHRAAWVFERGVEATVVAARRLPSIHPRCGTTFLAMFLVIVVPVFAATSELLRAGVSGWPDWPWLWRHGAVWLAHLAALPVALALAGEALRLAAAHRQRWPARLALGVGAVLQRLTVRRPNDAQTEVALVALLAALAIAPDAREVQSHLVRGLPSTERQGPRVRVASSPEPTSQE